MSESAIPAVEAALLAQLQGHTAEAPLVEGKPEPAPDEYVCLWEVESESEPGSLAPIVMMKEAIEVRLVIEVLRASAEDFAPPRERAQEIAAAVEAGFREDITLGRAWLAASGIDRKQQYFRTDKKRGCRIFLTFRGAAQT